MSLNHDKTLREMREWYGGAGGLMRLNCDVVPVHFDLKSIGGSNDECIHLNRPQVMIYLGSIETTPWDGPHAYMFSSHGTVWINMWSLDKLT